MNYYVPDIIKSGTNTRIDLLCWHARSFEL